MSDNDEYIRQANRELQKLAKQGQKDFARTRYLLCHRTLLKADNCGNLISAGPTTEVRNHCHCPKLGVFARMNIFEILAACFQKDAINLLLASAGNEYQFWEIVGDLFNASPNGGYTSHLDLPLPCPRSELQARLNTLRPFGFSTPASDLKREQFYLRMAKADFDFEKLESSYAAQLMEEGILLLYYVPHTSAPARLVVSPLFRKLMPVLGYQVPEDVDRNYYWTAD